MTIKKTLVLFFSLLISAQAFAASQDNLKVSLVFNGPADELYSWWGHVAIVIEDISNGHARYYDYGNFSFDQDSFVRNFVMGRLYFLKAASSPGGQYRYGMMLNRDITRYELNLSREQASALRDFLEEEIKPDNRVYLYDHFYDNCSTRIRDAIDMVLDGELHAASLDKSEYTIREDFRRFTTGSPYMDWLLNFAINGSIDREILVWDEMYLPAELEKNIKTLVITDSKGESVPLVASREVLNEAQGRVEIPEHAGAAWPLGLLSGIMGAVISAALLLAGRRNNLFNRLFGVFSAMLSLALALTGSLLLFMALFTDHAFSYWNQNLIFINPFLFVTLIQSIRVAAGKKSAYISLRRCWSFTAACTIIALLLKIIPAIYQDNITSIIFMILPAVTISALMSRKKSFV